MQKILPKLNRNMVNYHFKKRESMATTNSVDNEPDLPGLDHGPDNEESDDPFSLLSFLSCVDEQLFILQNLFRNFKYLIIPRSMSFPRASKLSSHSEISLSLLN